MQIEAVIVEKVGMSNVTVNRTVSVGDTVLYVLPYRKGQQKKVYHLGRVTAVHGATCTVVDVVSKKNVECYCSSVRVIDNCL